jgi:hypothetical protein
MLHVNEILDGARRTATALPDGRYVASRPIQFNGSRPGNQPLLDRIMDAWSVIRGKADAVRWEGQ